MKLRKLMSLFGVTVLASSLMIGCGNNDTEEPEVVEPETAEEAEAPETAEETEAPETADGVTGASESALPGDLVAVMTDGANWMFAAEADMTLETDLIIQGEHHRRNDSDNELARKLALYAHIREENEETGEMESTVTARYTLTVPNIIITSPNLLIQHGTVDGNVIVQADGFHLNETIITGDLVFDSQAYYEAAEINGTVMGTISVEGVDVVSAASESTDITDLVNVLTRGDNWMFAAEVDMTLETDLIIQGEHHRRNDSDNELARKLALYAQIREENEETGEMESTVTDEFTLTVPSIIVRSSNVLIQHGTVDGDIIVEGDGFHLNGTTITGDLIFASQALMDAADFEEGEVLGEIRVAE